MDAVFANLLAPNGRNLPSSYAGGRAAGIEDVATGSSTAESPADTAAPIDDAGDRVTLGSDEGSRSGGNAASLGDFLARMRRGGETTTSGATALSTSLVTASFSSFSLKATFANTRAASMGGDLFQNTLGELDEKFGQLSSLSPREAKRLGILLRSLAAMDPDNADAMLRRVSKALDALAKIGGGAGPSPNAAPPAFTQGPPQAAQSSDATSMQTSVEMVHFELDFEMEMTSQVRASIAEMRDHGIEVRTAELTTSQRVSIHIEYTAMRVEQKQADPLVLDLGGDGVDLTGVSDGADFDIDADGRTDRTAFVRGDDAFLALDRNGNGLIDNGSELFGDQHGAANGFAELKRFDENNDGRIDAADSIFGSLRLLHDRDGDGRVRARELSTLEEQGIGSIDLAHEADGGRRDANGNRLAETGYFTRTDGSRDQAVDAWLGYV